MPINNKEYYSTIELAQILGVSRIAIFKKIKSGQIHAEKIGRNFAIPKSELEIIVGNFVSNKRKTELTNSVKKVVEKYGEALRKLGEE